MRVLKEVVIEAIKVKAQDVDEAKRANYVEVGIEVDALEARSRSSVTAVQMPVTDESIRRTIESREASLAFRLLTGIARASDTALRTTSDR